MAAILKIVYDVITPPPNVRLVRIDLPLVPEILSQSDRVGAKFEQ